MKLPGAIVCTLGLALAAPARGGEPADGGTQVTVQVADGGETTVVVHHGALKVRAGGEETHVTSHQGVRVKRGQRARRLTPLPAPAALSPPDGAHVKAAGVALSWAKVAGARRYQILVERTGGEPWSREIESDDARARLELAPGAYTWSVHAVDAAGLEGRDTARQVLTVDVTRPKLKAGKPKWK